MRGTINIIIGYQISEDELNMSSFTLNQNDLSGTSEINEALPQASKSSPVVILVIGMVIFFPYSSK